MDYSRKINLLDADCTVSSDTSLLYRCSEHKYGGMKKERKNLIDNKDDKRNDSKYYTLSLDGKKLHDLYRHTTKLIK